jgi:hypothetical protein
MEPAGIVHRQAAGGMASSAAHAEHGGLGAIVMAGWVQLVGRQRASIQARPPVDLLYVRAPLLQLHTCRKAGGAQHADAR